MSANGWVRRVGAECFAALAVVSDDSFARGFMKAAALQLQKSKEPNSKWVLCYPRCLRSVIIVLLSARAGYALALGCMHMCLGGVRSSAFLKTTLPLLYTFALDTVGVPGICRVHSS